MKVYYKAWSRYLKNLVAEAEDRDPSRVETFNKLYQQTTVVQKTFWSQEEFVKHLVKYLSNPHLSRTANMLDVMAGQRMAFEPDQLKACLGAVKQALKDAKLSIRWETTPEAIYLLKG